MSKCIRCARESSERICEICTNNWVRMRTEVFNNLELKLGILSPGNHKTYASELVRMEDVWKSDKQQFKIELEKLNG